MTYIEMMILAYARTLGITREDAIKRLGFFKFMARKSTFLFTGSQKDFIEGTDLNDDQNS